jgi:hypothetical protein
MHHLNPFIIAFAVFAALFGSALLGLRLRRRLPEHHLSADTKDAVRLGMGSVATMAALVLGLLVASTKSAYDTEKNEVIQMAAKTIWLDRLCENYGPEAAACRTVLRRATHSAILRIWPDASVHRPEQVLDPGAIWSRDLPLAIQQLNPASDHQRTFKAQAAAAAADLGQMRWLLFEQAQSSVATPLLVMMVFWMALTYASIGLFAPPNGTVVAAQFLAALAVAGALFLILELDEPFTGLVRISSAPMVNALNHLGR